MNVSSNTLFHFTSSLFNLENILDTKFKLTFCKEVYSLNNEVHSEYYPMISFCDIPLSLAKDHIEKYGHYAIGLDKDWGILNKLNPVIYIENNSVIAKDIQDSFTSTSKILDSISAIQETEIEAIKKDLKNLFNSTKQNIYANLNVHRYIKNYSGDLTRNNKTIKNYRFYDEREWRYVPTFKHDIIKSNLNEEDYIKYRGEGKKKPLIEGIILEFTAKDIKYLIVKSNKDIPKLIRKIHSTNNLIKNSDEADILATKIMTVEQLNSDF